ncbi:MAG: Riboflavin biosynthesis protein RibBA [Candidatus Omnitrophica bacterium ADurb.Bin314]|jgi:3,4-dihydroxy 2-butanone 4-phosphate synthase/GTP cyclohydrolase II|nr:MAG: Riboflavin biosynthesis protein RibBA [Candidatus Omnitrophica bacterium ADurb.Bin314]HOE68722.1 bifunctional 3,4-dihydroxy-2-butanone-4-phosphate synthase/GTP cyclohydrolase II [Candidatus Omnitrophota bacterium]
MHTLNSIEEIIKDIREGRMVIMTDDEARENEGDLIFAAQKTTPELVNFMMKYGRGLICVPMAPERIEGVELWDMNRDPEDSMKTAFTVSVDARVGITTGISAYDRNRTIELLADPRTRRDDLVIPGHVFPLRARKGGVLRRAGHTEAAVDLAVLAGCEPVGVICEIINDDGKMARLADLIPFAKEHGLKIGTIQNLIEYRRRSDKLVMKVSEAKLPTKFGEWTIYVYRSLTDGMEHVALVKGKTGTNPALVRVHSECFTGDILGSLRCDCQDQLHTAMRMIEKEGKGVILYMRQEGRGIGLGNKVKAYALQDQQGLDTVQANEALGFKPDLRDYGIGAQILKDLGLSELRLITNNPRKIVGLEGYGLRVVERVPVRIKAHSLNARYLRTKQEKLGHFLDLNDQP